MENSKCESPEKRSLINSAKNLNLTVNKFYELANISERLLAKFKLRPEDEIFQSTLSVIEKNSDADIIDLFNDINIKLMDLELIIKNNIYNVIDMIE